MRRTVRASMPSAGSIVSGTSQPIARATRVKQSKPPRRHSRAVTVGAASGESARYSAAESSTYLAELTIEEGHASAAEKLARDAVKEFQSDQQADDDNGFTYDEAIGNAYCYGWLARACSLNTAGAEKR